MTKSGAMKRYNLVLPEELFLEVQTLADERQTTVVDLFRRFIKLGLLAANIEDDQDAALLIKQGEEIKQLVFL